MLTEPEPERGFEAAPEFKPEPEPERSFEPEPEFEFKPAFVFVFAFDREPGPDPEPANRAWSRRTRRGSISNAVSGRPSRASGAVSAPSPAPSSMIGP
jgi:hypothetical protein